jgi:hypothetical protein
MCRIGSSILIEIAGNPDGSDRVINDEVNAYHERSDLILVDGRWLESDGERIKKFEGVASCDADN